MIMTSVIILISLMMLDRFVQETTFMEAEMPDREFSYHHTFIRNAQRISEQTPPARVGNFLDLLDIYSKKAATLQLEECFCCDSPCEACAPENPVEWGRDNGCRNVSTHALNDFDGTLRIQSNTARIHSEIDLSTTTG